MRVARPCFGAGAWSHGVWHALGALCRLSGWIKGFRGMKGRFWRVALAAGLLWAEPEAIHAGSPPTNKPGTPRPWGRIVRRATYLEPPDSLLTRHLKDPTAVTWVFTREEWQMFPERVERAKVPAPLRQALLAGTVAEEGGRVVFYPPHDALDQLTPSMRDGIYPFLARNPANVYHAAPIHITSGSLTEWLSHSEIPEYTRRRFARYTWHSGKCLAFSDLGVFLSEAKYETASLTLLRAFTQARTFLVEVQIDPQTDRRRFIDYWTCSGERNETLPYLKSVAGMAANGPVSVDLAHLLPSLPRKLLYTFPEDPGNADKKLPHCHWTSLNFFNASADDSVLDLAAATTALVRDYKRVDPPYRFGDVIEIVSPEGGGYHSCINIADNLVFTKNGDNPLCPWVVLEMADISQIYMPDDGWKVHGYRKTGP